MQIKNDVAKFMQESNLSLFQLLLVVSCEEKQKISPFFPINSLGTICYLIIYTIYGQDLASHALSQLRTAFDFVNDCDCAIEKGNFDISKFRNHEALEKLRKSLPTTFFSSVVERLATQSLPMFVNNNKYYSFKIANNMPFVFEDILNYLQIKSADAFLYSAIIEGIAPDYISYIQPFLYSVWQMNDFVDDCIDYNDDIKNKQPNAFKMIENLYPKEGDIFEYAKNFLSKLESEILKNKLPEELSYLLGISEIFKKAGFSVIEELKNQFQNKNQNFAACVNLA
ncbi:MAG: hypothetical protein N2558_02405 [Patescibacteria group bacterium]|nr:hypothetical protein [Patescibacteria group bacterium]